MDVEPLNQSQMQKSSESAMPESASRAYSIGERLDRPERYHEAIHQIQLREWDPIGVAQEPAAQDEYDGYVHEIHGMVSRQQPRQHDSTIDPALEAVCLKAMAHGPDDRYPSPKALPEEMVEPGRETSEKLSHSERRSVRRVASERRC
jgi:hypothetical protein